MPHTIDILSLILLPNFLGLFKLNLTMKNRLQNLFPLLKTKKVKTIHLVLLCIMPFFSFSQQSNGKGALNNTIFTTWLEDPTSTMTVQWLAEGESYPAYGHIVNQENKAIDDFLSQFGVNPLNIVVSEKQ